MLLSKLIAKQGGLSDSNFSKKLGVSRTYWGQVKKGKWRIGKQVLTSIMQVFPELTLDVMEYLQEGDHDN